MWPAYQSPLMITSEDVSDRVMPLDGDCACPCYTRPTTPLANKILDNTVLTPPETYQQLLDTEYVALLSIAGTGGLAVLNRSALQVWETFAEGQSTATVVEAFQGRYVATAVRTLVRKLCAHGFLINSSVGQSESAPENTLTVWLHVTNACNLRCTYCYVQKSDIHMAPALGEQAIKAVVRTALEYGYARIHLKYAGGEALLNSNAIITMQRHAAHLCHHQGLHLDGVVLSNGTTLGLRACRLIHDLDLSLVVSLDALDTTQDLQRPQSSGAASLAPALRGVERAIASGIRPHLSITITPTSIRGLPDLVEWALKQELSFQFNFQREANPEVCCGSPWDDNPAVVDGLRRALRVIEAKPPHWSLLSSLADRSNLRVPRQHVCAAGRDYLALNHEGHIAQCHMLLDQPVTTITETNLLASVRTLKRNFKNLPVGEKTGCAICIWRLWCAGGCPIATYRAKGRYDTRSPYCELYQALLPEIVRIEGQRLLTYYANSDHSAQVCR